MAPKAYQRKLNRQSIDLVRCDSTLAVRPPLRMIQRDGRSVVRVEYGEAQVAFCGHHSVFDQTGFGMVLIGMPGLEKRAARYPQFFSRIGFVHEFRALAAAEVQTLLEENWTALASGSLAEAPAPDVVAAIIRVTGGNFRLITRLLTQMERVFKINQLKHLSPAVVETARESLVIGQV